MIFLGHFGVFVDESAVKEDPKRVHELICLAYEHINDDYLREAIGSGIGPLADRGEMTFGEYLEICEEIRIADQTMRAKRENTKTRRREYEARRAQLALAMIETGKQHVCSQPGCGETQDLTIDHIVPLSRGGSDDLSNLRFLCRYHNGSKSDVRQ